MDANKLPPENSTPLQFELKQLREAIAQLSARVDALEHRQSAAPPILPSSSHTEPRFGLALVNRAGALTLALGIIFFFKYAADNQWIGAEARVLIGVVAGLAMLAGAEWLRRRDRGESNLFTNGLTGCSIAIIYASAYASFGYYHLIIAAAAWIFLILISALTVILSIRHASPAIAALGFLGALLTPILLRSEATAPSFLFAYLVFIAVCALAVSLRQRWFTLIPALAGIILIAAAVSFETRHPGWWISFAFLLAAIHFAAASRFGLYPYLTAHGALLLGAMRLVALWAQSHAQPADRFSFGSALESALLGVYGIAALAFGIARSSLVNRTLGLVLLGLLIAKLYLWDVWQLSTFYRVSAFVLLGILLLAASYFYSRFRSRA
ncbi:MAG TPA: DUF2339 domain-containing protein [Bryobacteraceae bacterium]|jgi:uncharacterized membrane protein|nr:DUF2339 domain-containing protein [Bryobacteraceae bacterium]